MAKSICIFISLTLFMILNACKTTALQNQLQTGDLIFVETNEKDLSGAISRVTKNDATQISYDHIGLIEGKGRNMYVLHASTKKGSIKENIESFISTHKKNRLIVYRLKNDYKIAIPRAIHRANNMLGKPYNMMYVLNDSSYYCSDFIQRAFAEHNIFKLNPMTFVNPTTGKTDVYWKTFYTKHKHVVPEGELGCNPNGLANSSKIQKLFILNE